MKMLSIINGICLLSLLLTQCQMNQAMNSGIIKYEITVVIPDNTPKYSLYSKELHRQILEHNIPSARTVYFNGKTSVTQEETIDYGHKGLTSIFRDSSNNDYEYCKQYPQLNFCFTNSDLMASSEYYPPQVELTEEYKDILGYNCRKASIEEAGKNLTVWFTEEITVTDPTNAVIQHEGITGLILEMEEIPIAKNNYFFKRYTAKSLEFKPLGAAIFKVPDSYIKVVDTDEARKKNRKALEAEALLEITKKPHSEIEKKAFIGNWLFDKGQDQILVKIQADDKTENQFTFSSLILTQDGDSKQFETENAKMVGRKLLVEEASNYRLYTISDQVLQEENNAIFKYQKISEAKLNELKLKFDFE